LSNETSEYHGDKIEGKSRSKSVNYQPILTVEQGCLLAHKDFFKGHKYLQTAVCKTEKCVLLRIAYKELKKLCEESFALRYTIEELANGNLTSINTRPPSSSPLKDHPSLSHISPSKVKTNSRVMTELINIGRDSVEIQNIKQCNREKLMKNLLLAKKRKPLELQRQEFILKKILTQVQAQPVPDALKVPVLNLTLQPSTPSPSNPVSPTSHHAPHSPPSQPTHSILGHRQITPLLQSYKEISKMKGLIVKKREIDLDQITDGLGLNGGAAKVEEDFKKSRMEQYKERLQDLRSSLKFKTNSPQESMIIKKKGSTKRLITSKPNSSVVSKRSTAQKTVQSVLTSKPKFSVLPGNPKTGLDEYILRSLKKTTLTTSPSNHHLNPRSVPPSTNMSTVDSRPPSPLHRPISSFDRLGRIVNRPSTAYLVGRGYAEL